jgi:hypothetical protein
MIMELKKRPGPCKSCKSNWKKKSEELSSFKGFSLLTTPASSSNQQTKENIITH